MNKTYTIASGKGGTGKTVVTGALGKIIADRGLRVLLIDGDLRQGGLDITVGLETDTVFDLLDVASGHAELDKALVKIGTQPNLYFMAFSCIDRDLTVERQNVKRLFDALKSQFDYILIDCADNQHEIFDLFESISTAVIFVATPERTSIRCCERLSGRVHKSMPLLIVNKVRAHQIKAGNAPDIDYIIDRVGARLIGIIPEDESIPVFQNLGVPPNSNEVALHIADTAKRLLGENIRLRKV